MDTPFSKSTVPQPLRNPLDWLQVSVMDGYIMREILMPFLFGVGAFSSIGISVGALFELIRRVTESGLSIGLAMQIFVLKLPEFIVLAFPMSTLLATMMAYSRLSADSELIALRGCGVSIRRIIAPAIVFSIAVTGVTFAFNEMITPAANYQADITLDRALNSDRPPFRERNILYREFEDIAGDDEQRMKRLFYAERFDGERMYEVTVLDYSQAGLSQIVSADSAIFDIDEKTWDFYEGTLYAVSPDGSFGQTITFDTQEIQLPSTPFDIANRTKGDEEMNIAEASRYLDEVIMKTGDEKEIRTFKIRIQQKYSLPFVCVVFGLVGAALGVRPQRTGKATSFGISVVIIFSYYLIAFISNAMGEVGIFSPVISAWLPIFLFLGVGVLLLQQTSN
ncbi:LptF/LptG family permease [Halomicronema sp. CCY15110]|uniref:LptF/LptG family permease n=1 Tax=Halomicronema sp. CCY15110 TaxID=2767773 RepID=UPI001EF1C829|nr:LptF/LptG family permease [Halomicronema sp. CCY15110]